MKPIYTITSLKFWQSYLIQCRPYLMFISGIVGLTGISLSENLTINNSLFWLAFIPLFLGYGLGQALTDTWQTDTDKISASYRPLSKGIISIKSVRLISYGGLIACSLILIYLNNLNLFFGIISIVGLSTYTYFKKNYWFLGPIYNAWIVALLPIMGYLSVTKQGIEVLYNSKLIMIIMIIFFSYTNFVLMGYLKDIKADKETNYKTIPVIFGWNVTTLLGDLLIVICTILILNYVHSILSIILVIATSTLAIIGQLYSHFTKNKIDENANFSISITVRCIILWHISIIIDHHSSWLFYLILYYFLFELMLFMRPEKTQI